MKPILQPELPGLREPLRFEVREVSGSELAGTLAAIEARGGVIARIERIRGRNGVWRLRIRWPEISKKTNHEQSGILGLGHPLRNLFGNVHRR